jgi:hypothetical protein
MKIQKNYGAAAHARNLKAVKGTHVKTYGRSEVEGGNVPRSKNYKGSYEFSNVGEEVEQTDEALLPKQQAVADKPKASELAANKEKAGYKFGKSLRAAKVAAKMQKEETQVQYIEEKLTAADPASEWIKDFVASDNPKFEGKSKKERINMALGAYYAAKKSKNEATEKKYNEKEVKHDEKKQDKKKGSLNKIEMKPKIEMNIKGEAK